MRAVYRVRCGGIDVSSRLAPFLQSIEVDLSDDPSADTATIILEDSGGRLELPQPRAPLSVDLGWEGGAVIRVFEGFVDGVRGEGARGSGRELHVDAKSVDTQGKHKAPVERHFDNAKVGEALRKAGADAGYAVRVHPDLAGISRTYLALDGISFGHFGASLAAELGATFKMWGNQALLIPRNAGMSATGKPLTPVAAAAGVNLLRWSLSPVRGRGRWKNVRVRTWDPKRARWRYRDEEVRGGTAEAEYTATHPAADEEGAQGEAKGAAAESDRNKGQGSLLIIGAVEAQPAGPVTVIGTRPGLDGAYQSTSVKHQLQRGQGFTTSIAVGKPDAKSDNRKKS